MEVESSKVAELLTNLARRFRNLERHYQRITNHYSPMIDLSSFNLSTRITSRSPSPTVKNEAGKIPRKLIPDIEFIIHGARKKMI